MSRLLMTPFILLLSFQALAQNACLLLSGSEFLCEKTDGYLKIVHDPQNNKIAFVQVGEDFQVASWYPINRRLPVVFDSGRGSILTTPEISGRAKCGKDSIVFETLNILDNEKTEVIYQLTKSGLIISGEEEQNIICKKI